MPCRQNNTECTTTDRITNRPQVRGHTEAMEQEAAILRQQVTDLQTQLRENNIEPRVSAFPLQQAWVPPPHTSAGPMTGQPGQSEFATAEPTVRDGIKSENQAQEANVFADPTHMFSANSNKFVGMSSSHDESIISPVTGLSLSVFGTQVDLASFVSEETEAKLSKNSWNHLFQSISRGYKDFPKDPPPRAQLPDSYERCYEYGRLYLDLINSFLPILDKADFLNLVSRKLEMLPTCLQANTYHRLANSTLQTSDPALPKRQCYMLF